MALLGLARRFLKPIREERRLALGLVALLLVCETALCGLIVRFQPYTKIDFDAYMQQVRPKARIALGVRVSRNYTPRHTPQFGAIR